MQGVIRRPANTPYSQYPVTLSPCYRSRAHTFTSSPSFKIHWGQGNGTQSICSTLSFAFHASRLFLKWQYFDAVRGTHYHYFNFRGDTTQHCGKQQRVGVTRLLVSTDALNGDGIYTHATRSVYKSVHHNCGQNCELYVYVCRQMLADMQNLNKRESWPVNNTGYLSDICLMQKYKPPN